jgi:hypothetical protein
MPYHDGLTISAARGTWGAYVMKIEHRLIPINTQAEPEKLRDSAWIVRPELAHVLLSYPLANYQTCFNRTVDTIIRSTNRDCGGRDRRQRRIPWEILEYLSY